MGRPKKPLISRRKTLEAALRIVDEEGLEALSIRRLGRELNVQGISLYHHFASKEDILVGVCQLALEKVRTPDRTEADWREWLLSNAIELRRALQLHPRLLSVLIENNNVRIGLTELNASAGLLAVQGVPPDAIMPLLEGLGELALGSVAYRSVLDAPQSPEWKMSYPFLFHLSGRDRVDADKLFEAKARALLAGMVDALGVTTAVGGVHSGEKSGAD